MKNSTLSHKLWNDFLKGNSKALALIFRSTYDELTRYGLRLTPAVQLIEDSLQDMFLKLWRNRDRLSDVENIRAYLFQAFRRQVLTNIEFQRRFTQYEDPPEELFQIVYSHEDFLITKQLDKEKRERLISNLNVLTNKQKEAIHLRYFEGLNFDEISIVMNINLQSVRNNIHRGIMVLREIEK